MSAALTVLGSGDAFFSAGRGASCYLVEDALGCALVDCGPTAVQALAKLPFDPARLDSVLFTHLHGDHFLGWPFLVLDAVHRAKRTRPLSVAGPPGTVERLQQSWALAYPDTAQKPLPFAVDYCELQAGEARAVGGRRVEALRAKHQKPPHVALSLRVQSSAGPLAFTGDTGPHEGLAGLARGCRLLVAECTDLDAGAPASERRHLCWPDIAQLLPQIAGTPVLLAHLGSDARAAARSLEEQARALGADLRACEDGDRIDLHAPGRIGL